jgi:hypothetical protein
MILECGDLSPLFFRSVYWFSFLFQLDKEDPRNHTNKKPGSLRVFSWIALSGSKALNIERYLSFLVAGGQKPI